MELLSYELFNKVRNLTSGWINVITSLNEGISFSQINGKPEIKIDFDEDLPGDIVKLKDPVDQRKVTLQGTSIETFVGYKVERDETQFDSSYRNDFLDHAKKFDSISDSDLEALIDHTYPLELKKLGKQVKVLFVTGSGDPLSSRIADSLKKVYHTDAQIIDVMKAYYGTDIRDTINWDEYEKSGKTQKSQIDSYANRYSGIDKKRIKLNTLEKELEDYLADLAYDNRKNGTSDSPDTNYITNLENNIDKLRSQVSGFSGYIKKGGSIQTGQTRDKILKDGHMIDAAIISKVKELQTDWNTNKEENFRVHQLSMPYYLLVDDVIIGGSTTKRIFNLFNNALTNEFRNDRSINMESVRSATKGYVLFSYADRHDVDRNISSRN